MGTDEGIVLVLRGTANLLDLLSGPWILTSKSGEAKTILKTGTARNTQQQSMTSGFPQSLSAARRCRSAVTTLM